MVKPKVTIDDPASSPATVNSKNISISATVRFVTSSSEITVVAENGSIIPFTYVPNTFKLTVETTMPMNQTTYTISATNSAGSDSKSVTFNYVAPVTPTNPVVIPKKIICHHKADGSLETIEILESEWSVHQAHGDTQGKCVNNSNEQMITICHYPPGNTNNPQQIQIPASAWPAHQAHGDVLGACPTNKSGNGNNNGNGGKTNNDGNNTGGGKTNTTTTPVNNSPRTINNNQTTPKKEETVTPPKKEETTTPKKTETTSTPKSVTPVTEPKKEEKKEENVGSPGPRTIKPR